VGFNLSILTMKTKIIIIILLLSVNVNAQIALSTNGGNINIRWKYPDSLNVKFITYLAKMSGQIQIMNDTTEIKNHTFDLNGLIDGYYLCGVQALGSDGNTSIINWSNNCTLNSACFYINYDLIPPGSPKNVKVELKK